MNDQVKSIVRYALAFVGGFIVQYGYAEEGQWTEISGALLTLAAVGWSIWAKLDSARVPKSTLTSEQVRLTGVSPKP